MSCQIGIYLFAHSLKSVDSTYSHWSVGKKTGCERYFQSSGVLKNIFLAKNHIFRSKINTSSEGDIPMTPPKRNWLHFLVFKKEIEQFIMGRHKGGKDGRIARRDLNRRFWGAINEKTQQKLFTKKICLNSEEVNKRNKFSLEIAAKKIDFLNWHNGRLRF